MVELQVRTSIHKTRVGKNGGVAKLQDEMKFPADEEGKEGNITVRSSDQSLNNSSYTILHMKYTQDT